MISYYLNNLDNGKAYSNLYMGTIRYTPWTLEQLFARR